MINESLKQVVLCNPRDNVATAKSAIRKGTLLAFPGGKKVEAREGIPFAHKIALRKISRGEGVIKYGERIGSATRTIQPGEWVHIHNVRGERGKGSKK